MAARSNLRLVSFDGGGGARTFSQLRIMGRIMDLLNCDRNADESDKFILPCEHFDLMGGSGTGGLSAIMFGRLRMSVEEVSDEFFTIVEEVYKRDKLSPPERTQRLRECMEDVMERRGLPTDMKLMEEIQPGHCASFVLASPCTNAAEKVCLRTYPVRNQLASTITVIEGVLATCAVPPLFSSVTSGSGYNKQEYIGASFGATNPVREVITEAHSLFGGNSSVASLLSLGPGHPGVISFPSGDRVDLNGVMRDMMNDCEQRAQEIERQIGRVGIYFRFSVEQGMQSDRLGPVADPKQVSAQTESYIADHATEEKLSGFVQNFDSATRHITLDQLEYAGGSSVSIQSAATLEAILAALETDQEDAILAKLKVPNLEYGPHTAECMEGTRQDILGRINAWTTDFNAPNILWLKGHPGVGKSAIAASLVEHLREARRLGSLFFFQRQRANLMTTHALWRTVAYDLAREYPTIRKHVLAVLKADETIPSTFNADRLFRQFIKDPVLGSQVIPVGRSPIIVVDALDECGGLEGQHSSHRKNLLRTVRAWSSLPFTFKLIVTSRDESDIAGLFSRTTHHPIEIPAGQAVDAQSSEDIRTYLTYRFEQIALRYPRSLSLDWPGADAIVQMAGRAAGLFVWAETVTRFVDLEQPRQRLSLVLEGDGAGDMAALYEQILRTSFTSLRDDEVETLCSVIGTIILAKAPLSFLTLVDLLSMEDATVEQICNGLQSVLESQTILQFHHQSFVDFLIDPARTTSRFFVEQEKETRFLTMACLRVMKDELRFNICDLKSSYIQNLDIPDLALQVEQRILPHVSYSSLFWANHLTETSFDIRVFEYLQYFMDNQFLFWLEALSLLKLVNLASRMLLLLINWIRAGGQDDTMANDMRKFVSVFAGIISKSAPHIYLSALPFSPKTSPVSKQYRGQFPRTLAIHIGGLGHWPIIQNILSGHSHLVNSIAVSPDGSCLASGSTDKTIRIWDAETGEVVLGPLQGHGEVVTSVAFSPDGKSIASGSRDKTIRVWDSETGETISRPFEGHRGEVSSVTFSPDGKRIASGSWDFTIRLWNVATGQEIVAPLEGHSDWVNSVTFSPDGRRVISGSNDKMIRVWESETGKVLAGPIKGHTGAVTSVSFSPDGKSIVSGSRDKTIRIWDSETGEVLAGPFEGHSSGVSSVTFSPDGDRVASGSWDFTIRVWQAKTGTVIIGPLEGHSGFVNTVAFSSDGTRIFSGSGDGKIRVWDAETTDVLASPLEGHSGFVGSVAFSPDGKRIVSGSWDFTIRVWDAEMGQIVVGPLRGHSEAVSCVTFSPEGKRIVSCSWDKTIRVWNAETGDALTGPFEGHSGGVDSVAFSPDGKRIVSGSWDSTIRVWDAETGQMTAGPFGGGGHSVYSVAFSPDGKRIVSGSADEMVRVWDATAGQVVVGPLGGYTKGVCSVAFSPSGTRIISGSGDKMIRVWDAETGEVIADPLEGHSDIVSSVAFSPDGRHIISGSEDMTIRVWDAETGGMVLGPLHGHSGIVLSVSFSPDGRHLISGSGDTTIRVWDFMVDSSKDLNRTSTSFTNFSVIQDGWILGSSAELLFWVPPTLHVGLFRPNNRLVIGNAIATKLDLKAFVHGESWPQCRG